ADVSFWVRRLAARAMLSTDKAERDASLLGHEGRQSRNFARRAFSSSPGSAPVTGAAKAGGRHVTERVLRYRSISAISSARFMHLAHMRVASCSQAALAPARRLSSGLAFILIC